MSHQRIDEYIEKTEILAELSNNYLIDRDKSYEIAVEKAGKFEPLFKDTIENAVQEIQEMEEEVKTQGLDGRSDPNVINTIFKKHFQEYMKEEYQNSFNAVQEEYIGKGLTTQQAAEKTNKDFEPVFEVFQKYTKNTENQFSNQLDNPIETLNLDKAKSQEISTDVKYEWENTKESKKERKYSGYDFDDAELVKESFKYKNIPGVEMPPNNPEKEINNPLTDNITESVHATKVLTDRIYQEVKNNPNNPDFSKSFEQTLEEYKHNPEFVQGIDGFKEELDQITTPQTIKKSKAPIDWETEDVFFKIGYEKSDKEIPFNPKDLDKALTEKLLDQYADLYPEEEQGKFKKQNREEVSNEVKNIKENRFDNVQESTLTHQGIKDLNHKLSDSFSELISLREEGKKDVPVDIENITGKDVEFAKGMADKMMQKQQNYNSFIKATYENGFENQEVFKGLKVDPYVETFLDKFGKVEDKIDAIITEKGGDKILEDLQKDMKKEGLYKAFENLNSNIKGMKESNPQQYEEYKSFQKDIQKGANIGWAKLGDDAINEEAQKQYKERASEFKKEPVSSVEFTELIRETVVEMANRKDNGKTPDDILHEALQKNKNQDPKISEFIDELRDDYAKRNLTDTKRFTSQEEDIYKKFLIKEYRSQMTIDGVEEKDARLDVRVDKEVKQIIETKQTPIYSREASHEAKEKRENINSLKEDSFKQQLKNNIKSVAAYYTMGYGPELEAKMDKSLGKESDLEKEIKTDLSVNRKPSLRDKVAIHFPNRKVPESGYGTSKEENTKGLEQNKTKTIGRSMDMS